MTTSITIGKVAKAIGAPSAAADWQKNLDRWGLIYSTEVAEAPPNEWAEAATSNRTPNTLNMGKHISADWASLIFTENTTIEAASKKKKADSKTESLEQQVLDGAYDDNFTTRFIDGLEYTFALGTGALELVFQGLLIDNAGNVTADRETTAVVDIVPAEAIIPLKWLRGVMLEVAFVSYASDKGGNYVDVREHRTQIIAGVESRVIINRRFRLTGDKDSDSQVLIPEPPPEGVAPMLIFQGAPRMFAMLSPALKNNVDVTSPYGISVYANAESQLATADLIFDNFAEDFELGRKMVFMPETMMRRTTTTSDEYPDGRPIPPSKKNQNVFVSLEDPTVAAGGDASKIHEHNPDLRVEDNTTALRAALSYLSEAVGMGSGRYQLSKEGTLKTATEVISENSALYRSRRKHLLAIFEALTDISHAILWSAVNLLGVPVDPETEIIVRADDSVIEDDGTRIARGLTLFQAGAISQLKFLIDYMMLSETDAEEEVARGTTTSEPLF